jgi:hypothetical protein
MLSEKLQIWQGIATIWSDQYSLGFVGFFDESQKNQQTPPEWGV